MVVAPGSEIETGILHFALKSVPMVPITPIPRMIVQAYLRSLNDEFITYL